ERYGHDIGDVGGHQAPLGLLYLASFLEKNGFEVSLIDAEAQRYANNQIIEKIKLLRPDVIGITSTTVAFHRACAIASDIKKTYPQLPVVIGGPHVSANPRETLSLKCFDFGVVGEGEVTALNLFRAICDGKPVDFINGLVYIDKDSGKIKLTEARPYISDLDSLPFPARHLLPDIRRYKPPLGSYLNTPVASMITSRGCPYGCIFCDKNVFGDSLRYHSPDYIISEIEDMIGRFGAREIAFLDDTFIVDTDRVRNILYLMKQNKINVSWSCMTRADILTRELLQEMKSAGCWQMSIGVESGNQKVLDFMNKNIRLEDIRKVAAWCRQLGIYSKAFFMIGHPIDNIDTINETVEFAKSNPFDDIVVTIVTPMPGTRLYDLAPDYGRLTHDDTSDFSYWKPVFVPNGLEEGLMYRKQAQFYRDFYCRPGTILRQLGKIRSIPQLLKCFI
nr:radical SAM protein [Candidatus Omnitrophota bacterium]